MFTSIYKQVEAEENIYLGFGFSQVAEEVSEQRVKNSHAPVWSWDFESKISHTQLSVNSNITLYGWLFNTNDDVGLVQMDSTDLLEGLADTKDDAEDAGWIEGVGYINDFERLRDIDFENISEDLPGTVMVISGKLLYEEIEIKD